MLGNDVIDLADPETLEERLHPRFDARVFTGAERALLARSPAPGRLRWRLWAVKEAAYKCAVKLAPGTRFTPARFEVGFDDERHGSVRWGTARLRFALFEEGERLHAVATDGADPERAVLQALCVLPDGAEPERASGAVGELARGALAAELGCAAGELAVGRRGRIPILLRRGAPLGLDCSLAHHGRFAAAAIEREQSAA
jgi:phosphopantetheinyl transferase (holo-ACP synthase)